VKGKRMHPRVFDEFNKICGVRNIQGDVLEVGATLDDTTLLNLPALRSLKRKVGINKQSGGQHRDFLVLQGDANLMSEFRNGEFDAVLCNAVLEHDPFFWRTLAEMRRVIRIGGLLVIGTPGFSVLPFEGRRHRLLRALFRLGLGREARAIDHSTLTLRVHRYPADYYRFSPDAFREVFFQGMADVAITMVLTPPRLIGHGLRVAR